MPLIRNALAAILWVLTFVNAQHRRLSSQSGSSSLTRLAEPVMRRARACGAHAHDPQAHRDRREQAGWPGGSASRR